MRVLLALAQREARLSGERLSVEPVAASLGAGGQHMTVTFSCQQHAARA